MFRILTLLLMFILGNMIQAQGWDVQVIDPGMSLADVYTFSADEAIVVGNKLVLNGAAAVYRTTNSGASWDTLFTISAGRMNEMEFLDDQNGWIVGWELDPLFQTPNTRVWKTNDGGITWLSNSQGLGAGQGFAVEILSNTDGWVFGKTNQLFATELYCLNSGLPDWQMNCPLNGIGSNQIANMRDMFFLNTDYGWMASSLDTIYVTTNGGASWNARPLPALIGASPTIYFLNELQGWVVDNSGGYFSTADGGISWNQEMGIGSINDIQFPETNVGWIAGDGGNLQNSIDGGNSWIQQPVTTQNLNAVSFVSPDTGYIVGTGGVVLSTVTGGATGIEDQSDNLLLKEMTLLPNYPNPFNPSTTLQFELQRRSNVLLQITDVSGRHVRTLVNDSRSAGHHEVKWDGRDDAGNSITSGVYLSRLESKGVVQSQKMLLVR